MASIMDMLADVPFEEKEEEETVDEEPEIVEENSDKREDLFKLTDDEEEENNDSNNITSYYTEPIILENNIKNTAKSKTRKSKTSGNNTDTSIEGDDVTQKDPSKSDVEDSEDELTQRRKKNGEVTQKEKKKNEGKRRRRKKKDEKDETLAFALPGNPDPNGPKYCHCRWGESGVMVECEECGEWYHDECIGLTEEETYNIETYYCAPCCSSNSELITRYKEDPVILRQKIIEEIRKEELMKKPRRKKQTKNSDEKKAKVATPKTPKTPKPKVPKPKNVAQTERKPRVNSKRNKILNKSLPSKRNFSFSGSDGDDEDGNKKRKEERVAFVMCEVCGDSFSSKRALSRHTTKQHTEQVEVKYECDECPKVFNTAKSLRDHEVMHSGVKPFSCMFCGEAFYLMSQLTSHTNLKHLNVRHQCDQCPRSYSNRPSLMCHMKKIHGEGAESD